MKILGKYILAMWLNIIASWCDRLNVVMYSFQNHSLAKFQFAHLRYTNLKCSSFGQYPLLMSNQGIVRQFRIVKQLRISALGDDFISDYFKSVSCTMAIFVTASSTFKLRCLFALRVMNRGQLLANLVSELYKHYYERLYSYCCMLHITVRLIDWLGSIILLHPTTI